MSSHNYLFPAIFMTSFKEGFSKASKRLGSHQSSSNFIQLPANAKQKLKHSLLSHYLFVHICVFWTLPRVCFEHVKVLSMSGKSIEVLTYRFLGAGRVVWLQSQIVLMYFRSWSISFWLRPISPLLSRRGESFFIFHCLWN